MKESKFQQISFDIMDALDGIYLGCMSIDTNKDIIVDIYGEKPVVSKARLLKIIRDRRPSLMGRDIDICARKNSFVLDRMA